MCSSDLEDEDFSIRVDDYEFRILEVENRMIKSVLAVRLPGDGETQQNAQGA